MDTLAYTPAWKLAELIRRKKLSPVELTDHLLRRIDRINPRINAYLTVAHEQAMAAARAAEAALTHEDKLPPLHGVPVSIKDLVWTKGLRTTAGSLIYKDFVPEQDATLVERLRQAGVIILGKTNTPELGHSVTTENRLGDDCRNPWNAERTSGGSSGGAAAAAAAGLGPLAIGNDGGGSIRIPAAFCGVFGFKPTNGLVSNYGCLGDMDLFAAAGPIARSVRDAALCLNLIAGHDPRDAQSLRQKHPDFVRALSRGVKGLRVAWSPDLGYARVEPEVLAAAKSAAYVFEDLGCHVEEATPATGEPFSVHNLITMTDDCAAISDLEEKHGDLMMGYVRSVVQHGRKVSGAEYSKALRALERYKAQMADFFERYDLLLTPATAVSAFPVGQRPRTINGAPVDRLWGACPFSPAFNMTRQPAATVPCDLSKDGLPLGLQIVAPWGHDAMLLRACAAFEESRPWADKTPPLDV